MLEYTMFHHSIRVPRHYKIVANIIKKVSTEGGSVKTLLYDNKLRHFRTNVLCALINETIKHATELDKIFEECNLLTNEPRLDPWLAKVLATELLYGKKTLPGQSKPEQTILSYKEQFEKYASDNRSTLKTEDIRRPRYIRINTNLLTTSDAIRAFQDEGYKFIRCTSGSYDDYLKQIQGLTEYDFTQDYHVKTVFVFAPGTKLHDHDLYLENKIILQDKATAMAVHLLAPPPGSVVMDMCAAPGNKTTQLAAFMRNQGKVYAIERNEQRYNTLCDFVEKTGSTCVETLHRDSLELKRGDFDDVEYILLDPSCSGSGMTLSVHNYVDENRLAKLTSLQEKFLKHAMNSFPNAKKIVYSTCSLFPEENERVVTNVVKLSRSKWIVQDVKKLLKDQWNNIGSGMYGIIGPRCLYARPELDLTTGFFLAVLERDKKSLEKSQNSNEPVNDNSKELVQTNKVQKKRKHEINIHESNIKEENETNIDESNIGEQYDEECIEKKEKKKKHKKKESNENGDVRVILKTDADLPEALEDHSEEITEKKKKKKLKNNTESLETSTLKDANVVYEVNNMDVNKKKKKRMKTEMFEKDRSYGTPCEINNPKKKNKKESVEIEGSKNFNMVQYHDLSHNETNEIPIKKKKKDKVIKLHDSEENN